MDAENRKLVESLNAAPAMAVVACTGAGAQSISWLLGVPGASRTVLEAVAPYSPESLAEFIGHEPEQSVSAETAMEMAQCAYRRAVRLRDGDAPVVGLGCTAAISTDRPKRGEHRCHVAAWNSGGLTTYSLSLVKGRRRRTEEEFIVSKLVMRALAESMDVDAETALDLGEQEQVEVERTRYLDPIKALLARHVESVTVHSDGTMAADERTRGGVLAGSFNPPHPGHEELAAVASEMLEAEVTFELSIRNVDKPPLEESQVRERVARLEGVRPVAVTWAEVFHEKARLFPGCTFVIGMDTASRLLDPRYYGGDEVSMFLALEKIRSLGCRFLVAGRVLADEFRTLDDLPVPGRFEDMLAPIPESRFRRDLSSTDLRPASKKR